MMRQAERDNDMSIRLIHDYYLKVKSDHDNSTRLSRDDWQILQNIQQLKMTMTTVPVYPMMTGRYSRIYNS